MSGFITTMFVSSPFSVQFPAKPKPISPISTFVQSQSCMNLRTDLFDFQERGVAGGIWMQGLGRCDEKSVARGLAIPQETYKSPLQRLGEALRLPQCGNALTWALAEDGASAVQGRPSQKGSINQPARQVDPMRPPASCAYSLVPGGTNAHAPSKLASRTVLGSGQGTSLRPSPHPPRDNGYFANPDLHSSLISNPRTRAPFKPQKSNRGTSSWQLKQYAEATLGSGSLRKAVKLPEGEDKDEWLAVNSENAYTIAGTTANVYRSRRLLQPDQPAVRVHHRVLLAAELP
jgi:MOB kinase activator 1